MICEIAQIGQQSGGETEFGSEVRDGVTPTIRSGADPEQNRSQVGIDSAPFVGPDNTAGFVDEVEIVEFRHLQNSASARFA